MPVSESMISALIDLKRVDDEGLAAQLTGQLRNLIAAGRLGKGRALPSSRRLASDLGVSRNTVTYAFEQLAAEGYLETSRGRRPVVTADGGAQGEGWGRSYPARAPQSCGSLRGLQSSSGRTGRCPIRHR